MSRQYQDQWAQGRVESRGYRESAARYEVVRDALSGLPRPFTVLDLGARRAYFSLRLAEDLDAVCTALDRETLVERAVAMNPGTSVTPVVRTLSGPSDLRDLGTFDVVLALSVLHHFPHVWRDMLDELTGMARTALLVEAPASAERVQVRDGDDFRGLAEEVARRGRRLGSGETVFSAPPDARRGIYWIDGGAPGGTHGD